MGEREEGGNCLAPSLPEETGCGPVCWLRPLYDHILTDWMRLYFRASTSCSFTLHSTCPLIFKHQTTSLTLCTICTRAAAVTKGTGFFFLMKGKESFTYRIEMVYYSSAASYAKVFSKQSLLVQTLSFVCRNMLHIFSLCTANHVSIRFVYYPMACCVVSFRDHTVKQSLNSMKLTYGNQRG